MVERRRHWSLDEKRSICRQTSAPGVSVAQVARRYSMNANLIFKWLRDERFAPGDEVNSEVSFLPVEIDRVSPIDATMLAATEPSATSWSSSRFRIELAGGHRIVAEGAFDADALGRLLKSWLL